MGPPARRALERVGRVQAAPHTRPAEGVTAGEAQRLPVLRVEDVGAYLTPWRHVSEGVALWPFLTLCLMRGVSGLLDGWGRYVGRQIRG